MKRTTVTADAEDLALLEREAERRGIALGRLLGELVAARAEALRDERPKPRGAVFSSPPGTRGIAEEMDADPDAPWRTPFRP